MLLRNVGSRNFHAHTRSFSAAATRKPLSSVLPPLILGTAPFNSQYNSDEKAVAQGSTPIVHDALRAGIRAFDTSPYYGPAEILLGQALKAARTFMSRSEYTLLSKCGRVEAAKFDYSPTSIRKSINRSLERLGTDYLDLVFCHDVEFVDRAEVLDAVATLRELRGEGKIRYIGISGYPLEDLVSLAKLIRDESDESLDAVMSYAHYTLQNSKLHNSLDQFQGAGVECVLNGSPLGMGLLRSQGVPIGGMGDFHPAPKGLREYSQKANEVCSRSHVRLESLALRFALEGWSKVGSRVGTTVNPLIRTTGELREIDISPLPIGVSVAGVSSKEELGQLVALWNEVVEVLNREALYERVTRTFGDEWKNYSWPSP